MDGVLVKTLITTTNFIKNKKNSKVAQIEWRYFVCGVCKKGCEWIQKEAMIAASLTITPVARHSQAIAGNRLFYCDLQTSLYR